MLCRSQLGLPGRKRLWESLCLWSSPTSVNPRRLPTSWSRSTWSNTSHNSTWIAGHYWLVLEQHPITWLQFEPESIYLTLGKTGNKYYNPKVWDMYELFMFLKDVSYIRCNYLIKKYSKTLILWKKIYIYSFSASLLNKSNTCKTFAYGT